VDAQLVNDRVQPGLDPDEIGVGGVGGRDRIARGCTGRPSHGGVEERVGVEERGGVGLRGHEKKLEDGKLLFKQIDNFQ
jgi:hypothetical protein